MLTETDADMICKRILRRFEREGFNFMERINTVDKIWASFYTHETKQQSTMFCQLVDTVVLKVHNAQWRIYLEKNIKHSSWFTLTDYSQMMLTLKCLWPGTRK